MIKQFASSIMQGLSEHLLDLIGLSFFNILVCHLSTDPPFNFFTPDLKLLFGLL